MSVRGSRRLAVSLLAAGLALPAGFNTPPAMSQAARPNVLIIVTDDQRVDTLGVMRATKQWFISGGMTFPNTFATTPLCCPSRASIMTGQYAHNHGVQTNRSGYALDHHDTLQRYLQEAGYTTAMVGKLLNQWRGNPPYFDRWASFEEPSRYYRPKVNVDGNIRRAEGYSTDYVASKGASLIGSFEARDTRPWYLYLSPFAPHDPYAPAKRHRRAKVGGWTGNPAVREEDLSDKPAWVNARLRRTTLQEGQEIRQLQLRTLMAADDMVRKVFQALRRLGELKNTLAVFVSDNGKHWGEHGLSGKQDPYTEALMVPLYVRWPRHFPDGALDRRLAANVDIAPTVLEAAGVSPDPGAPMDGRSLLQSWQRDRVFSENKFGGQGVPSWASIRTPTYQYVEYHSDDLNTVTFREYYDLVNDPWQLHNVLADADPSNDPSGQELTRLSIQIRQDRDCRGAEGPGSCP